MNEYLRLLIDILKKKIPFANESWARNTKKRNSYFFHTSFTILLAYSSMDLS